MAEPEHETRDGLERFGLKSIHDEVWHALMRWEPHLGQGVFSGRRVSVAHEDGVSEVHGVVPNNETFRQTMHKIIDGTANAQQGFRATFTVREFNDRASELEGDHTSDTDKETARRIRAYVARYSEKLPQ